MSRACSDSEKVLNYDDDLVSPEPKNSVWVWTPATWSCKGIRFVYKASSPVKIRLTNDDRHVPSSTPLPFSIRRRAKRTSCRPSFCIKYASGQAANRFTPYTQRSGGSSGYSTSSHSPPSSNSRSPASHSPPSSQHSFIGYPSHPPPNSRLQPRIQVSSLLASPQSRTYRLEVVQHPQRTAEFGHASLSRLPITPPIIAQLTVTDPSGNSVVPEAELPFLVAHLSLYLEDDSPLNMGSDIGCGSSPPILYGNLVSSVEQLEDPQGNMGLYFVFSDVSIRWRGQYKLGISLTKLSETDPSGSIGLAGQGTVVAEARTRIFDVLALNQYTAVPPTRLTQCFLRQGARMFTYMPPTSS